MAKKQLTTVKARKYLAGRKLSAGEIFAVNLRGLMAMQGVTATEMQEFMGISETTYYKRLNKRPHEFTVENMERAAKRLGVSPAAMIEGVMAVGGTGVSA